MITITCAVLKVVLVSLVIGLKASRYISKGLISTMRELTPGSQFVIFIRIFDPQGIRAFNRTPATGIMPRFKPGTDINAETCIETDRRSNQSPSMWRKKNHMRGIRTRNMNRSSNASTR